ncbi:hypothetical protein BC833DRAFT_429738 [Globomyces pollinis-pini]|nr:hypothetical protein BC833DRAFT_429738 [Globomyces pollinis-pini]
MFPKMQLNLLIIFHLVHGLSVLQVQFQNSFECLSPPTTMYKFKVSQIFDMQPSMNETWPDFYSFAVQETPIGFCGGLSVALVHDCCISSLDLDASFGIASGAAMIVPDNDFDYAISHYASGGNYCVLQADEFGLVNGYHAVYILNDNTCYDRYKCSVNGAITIYNQTKCEG